jgi:hypothetical protein
MTYLFYLSNHQTHVPKIKRAELNSMAVRRPETVSIFYTLEKNRRNTASHCLPAWITEMDACTGLPRQKEKVGCFRWGWIVCW